MIAYRSSVRNACDFHHEHDVDQEVPVPQHSAEMQGRRFLVTGGARGIGSETVTLLAQHGAVGACLDLAPGPTPLPEGWHHVHADLVDDASTAHAVRSAHALLGGLDGVVASAGVVPGWSSIADADLDDYDRVMAVNARGLVSTIKHAAPLLDDGATIVALASLNAWRGDPNLVSYAASKHAVLGIVRSAAMELGRRRIRVNAVGPGPVATAALRSRMAARAERTSTTVEDALDAAARLTALGQIATEHDVAHAVLFLSSAASAATTGQLLKVDGGLL